MISGEKKKHRKEMMAAKRLDRMIRRGVDLQQINLVRRKANSVFEPDSVYLGFIFGLPHFL